MKLVFENLSKEYGERVVFENISGEINSGDIIGLIGVNGIGKTTLAKILAGLEACDWGQVRLFPGHAKVHYSEQFPHFNPRDSVYDVVYRKALSGDGEDPTGAEVKAKKALKLIGFEETVWSQKASSLSGGEKTKLSLCKAMVSDFDFLLLDEPSNHLDVESCGRLEEYIQGLDKPVLIISHDRYLLDSTASKIWELTEQGLKVYEGNYSAYKSQKEIETLNAEREYEKQQDKIQRLKDMIRERKEWYASAHKGAGQNDFYRAKAKKHTSVLKAKERELEKLEQNKVEKPKKDVSPAFEVINKSVNQVKFPPVLIQGKNLYKNYGEKVILDNASFTISRGEKISLVGPNGSGKTTFLRLVCRMDHEYKGTISMTPSLKMGYFAQELDILDPNLSILDQVLLPGRTVAEARLLLASLLFRGNAVFKKVGSLSMGEKGRVAFARLILSGANMLVLDEPTNYMDIVSREKIEDVLEEFGGAVLFVSHDRYFNKRLANRVFSIKDGKLLSYEGDYSYYLEKSREEKGRKTIGREYKTIADDIRRLENRLALLSGKLNEVIEEEEKNRLNDEFIKTARELNACKKALETGQ